VNLSCGSRATRVHSELQPCSSQRSFIGDSADYFPATVVCFFCGVLWLRLIWALVCLGLLEMLELSGCFSGCCTRIALPTALQMSRTLSVLSGPNTAKRQFKKHERNTGKSTIEYQSVRRSSSQRDKRENPPKTC
jgi:hypothetical protein